MLASNRLIMSFAYTYTLPAYLILCPCFISRRKPAREKKKKKKRGTCATGIAMCTPVHVCVRVCMCVWCVRASCCTYLHTYVCLCAECVRVRMYIFHEWQREREIDIGRASSCLQAGQRRRKRRIRGTKRERERERICTFLRDRRYARTSSASTLCPFPLLLLLPCSSSHFRPASVLPLCPSCRPVCLFRPFPIRPLHPARSFSPRCVHCVQTCRYAARVYLLRGSRQRSPLLGWFQREINRVQTRIAASG